MRYAYIARLTQEEGGISVSFPSVPEAITWGESEAEALSHAADALMTALSMYVDDGRTLPVERDEPTQDTVMITVTLPEAV
ncbi:Hypothetical protein GbCGDNIH3_7043 [Granulibacter bethesdensis]|uniref:HicB-like antitoxin of toxin-antitoxin system domain-containing protein n=1 Tax=Granulibacter bethesdensis TaxID=364410 RepID=A0AAN0RE31_9PROT|nr:type II toxin-antitoxin system HicB family antitoxin [Granulibacter bethesdensis]AHJ63267.1 Hypothetical protein GbCGDNIH3_7043 [Granulibacter bethesdensis]